MTFWKRASSAMDGKLRAMHEVWIPAIPGHSLTGAGSAEMTRLTEDKELELKHPANQD
ncbi:MAG: hypothetical protein KGZ88_20160 [Methylomicrobium sp.]|nr:hypothetical protein [Methylomicrobium sp.]